MSRFRDVSSPNANEWRDLLPEELDCVMTVEDFVRGRWQIERESCQVLTDIATRTIFVKGKLANVLPPNELKFEARIHPTGTITFKI